MAVSQSVSIFLIWTVVTMVVFGNLGCAFAAPGTESAWTPHEQQKGYLVFPHSTLDRLPSTLVPSRKMIADRVICEVARGEFESVQIGVYALSQDVSHVRLDVESDLDVTLYTRRDPDVELKWPALTKPADVWERSPDDTLLEYANVLGQVPAGTSANFWLTFHVPAETSAGVHKGKIRIKPEGRSETTLDLEVHVRPFQLQRPRIAFAMYHNEDYLPGFLNRRGRELTARIYQDMADHGQTAATFYSGGDLSHLPPRNCHMIELQLPLAKQAGLVNPNIPCMWLSSNITSLKNEQRQAAVAWLQAECKRRGWPELLQYAVDEPVYPNPKLRATYGSLRDISMRVVTAMSINAFYGFGDIHDMCVVLGGQITPEMHAEAKRFGAELHTYSYATWRFYFSPLRQRFYAGVHTWAQKLKGNWIWGYYDTRVHSHVWWKDGDNRPMPTTAWENRREGIDDYRYLQMLEDCIAANAGDPLAIEAASWLEALRARVLEADPHIDYENKVLVDEVTHPLPSEEFDQIRARAANYIQHFGSVPEDQIQWPSVTYLKDEGKSLRNRSVDDCLAELASPDASRRRAAAWALFEHGPQAASASKALARVLDDPDVRMPALHALEAIGPRASAAVPQIARLLSHPDAFIRVGATFTLKAIGTPAEEGEAVSSGVVEGLRTALWDERDYIARTAGAHLTKLGPAASAALPDALELLKRDKHAGIAIQIIAALAPESVAAIPTLIERYEAAKGGARSDALALARFGSAAVQAIPVLERYVNHDENTAPHATLYALHCIRGDTADLRKMVDLFEVEEKHYGIKGGVAGYLKSLGVKAAPVAGRVREILAKGSLKEKHAKVLREFLEGVEKGEGATMVSP